MWINNQLFWSTGKQGRNIDLAGLVCNGLEKRKGFKCVNPCKGQIGGDTWEERRKFLDRAMAEVEKGKEQ